MKVTNITAFTNAITTALRSAEGYKAAVDEARNMLRGAEPELLKQTLKPIVASFYERKYGTRFERSNDGSITFGRGTEGNRAQQALGRLVRDLIGPRSNDKPAVRVPRECSAQVQALVATYGKAAVRAALGRV